MAADITAVYAVFGLSTGNVERIAKTPSGVATSAASISAAVCSAAARRGSKISFRSRAS